MRRIGLWVPVGILAVLAVTFWGVWTWRVGTANRDLALQLEAERQRNFADMAYHVEKIQGLLGKGLVTGSTRQNMRYMSDVHHHAMAAAGNFNALPLPAELNASVGKFLQQTGDFAWSVMRQEASGGQMGERQRQDLFRLQEQSETLSADLQSIMAQYNQGGFRWNPPMQFSWANLVRGPQLPGKPTAEDQAPSSMVAAGWDRVGTAMERLPVFIYDGPFSDGVADRAPAMSGPPVDQAGARQKALDYVPNSGAYTVTGMTEVANNLPAYSFRLAPTGARGGENQYTTTVEVTKNGGYLAQVVNSRMGGKPTIDLARAKTLGQQYLASVGYPNMAATYGQVQDGFATIAYAYREAGGVMVYPDQIKVKVALDNGEIVSVDARQYLMSHHTRTLGRPKLTAQEAQEELNAGLTVQRAQLALIPNAAGTGETLTYEFLTQQGDDTFLVYINANTGAEEQILQQIQSDGGTFTL